MLKEAFNETALHLKDVDFNYSIRGDMESVGRIATNNFQEHKSDHHIQKKRKKDQETYLNLLRQQQFAQEMEAMMDRMNDILDDLNKIRISNAKGREALNSDDISDKLLYLQEYASYTPEQLEDKTAEELNDLIEQQLNENKVTEKQLKQEYNNIRKKYEQKANGAEDPKLREYYLKKLEEIDQKATANGYNPENLFAEVCDEDGYSSDLFRKKLGLNKKVLHNNEIKTAQIDNIDTKLRDELPSTKKSPFANAEGLLTDSFNDVAALEGKLDSELKEELSGNDLGETKTLFKLDSPGGMD